MGISPVWRVAAALYIVINVGGGVYAARMGEPVHAALHVGLLLLGGAGWLWWRGRTDRTFDTLELSPEQQRLEQLQQSVDAIAIEVERIGEAQRFSAKLQAERSERPR